MPRNFHRGSPSYLIIIIKKVINTQITWKLFPLSISYDTCRRHTHASNFIQNLIIDPNAVVSNLREAAIPYCHNFPTTIPVLALSPLWPIYRLSTLITIKFYNDWHINRLIKIRKYRGLSYAGSKDPSEANR